MIGAREIIEMTITVGRDDTGTIVEMIMGVNADLGTIEGVMGEIDVIMEVSDDTGTIAATTMGEIAVPGTITVMIQRRHL